jgi:hypothetical protein
MVCRYLAPLEWSRLLASELSGEESLARLLEWACFDEDPGYRQ